MNMWLCVRTSLCTYVEPPVRWVEFEWAATVLGYVVPSYRVVPSEDACDGFGWCKIRNNINQKLYVSTKMSVMKHIFAPLLLRCKEPPMHKQHCRSSIDTMKSLSPAALTLKPLRRPSNRSSPRQRFIRLCSHITCSLP
jgi:hypothetical protein